MVSQHALAIIRLRVDHASIGQNLQGESVENIPDETPEEMMSLKLPLCQDLRAPWKPF